MLGFEYGFHRNDVALYPRSSRDLPLRDNVIYVEIILSRVPHIIRMHIDVNL